MLRGESEAVAADAPPNGASHANGKLFCQVLCSMPSHKMVLQVKQCKLVSPYSETIEHLCSGSGGLSRMALAICLKACTDCQVCSWSTQYFAAFMRPADQCQSISAWDWHPHRGWNEGLLFGYCAACCCEIAEKYVWYDMCRAPPVCASSGQASA